MKPVQYMKGENFTENRGKPRHKLVGGLGSHKPIVRVVGRQEDVRGAQTSRGVRVSQTHS